MPPKTIVLFGQTGAGKSSVVNLMAGKYMAPTSPDMNRCTMDWKEYSITFDGCDYRVFDTVGLMEPELGSEEHPDAIENARTLITKLDNEGGIDLLLFCVRPRRSTSAIEVNYRRFRTELLHKKKIPIILVVTGLEGEDNMEDWWPRNRDTFNKYNIVLDGHACIIAVSLDGRHQRLYEESRQLVRNLIKEHAQGNKNIVLFGQSGVGKSSVVNLMAEENRAETSLDTRGCTMHWKEHPIAFDGYNYKVFDTVGLEEPQLGIQEYLHAISNARNLIMKLEKEGGIDLLLFCIRAGRLPASVGNNYRLFYEWLCEKEVPIVLVITGLEGYANMEDWWTKNKESFDKCNIVVDGHACITAVNMRESYQRLYDESRQLIRNLVREHTRGSRGRPDGGWKGGEGWFMRFFGKLRELIRGDSSMKKKDVVSFLTTRYGMPPEVAGQLAKQVGKESRWKPFAY